MERAPVTSSNVVSIGYDESSETLEVEFTNGNVYQYYNVPNFLFERLIASDSKGKFINAEIKHAYSYSKM